MIESSSFTTSVSRWGLTFSGAIPRRPPGPLPCRRSARNSLSCVADEELGYERARDELAEVVRKLEAGGLTLEESLALWERGEYLAKVCQEWLDGARARLAAAMSAEDSSGEE